MTGVQAYLALTDGSFDTDLVTERIGLAPDILRRREAGPHGEVSTEWGIRTELEISHNDEVEPALRSLLRRIPCGPQALCEVARTHTAERHILILVKMYEKKFPTLYFPRDVIRYMAQLHGAIGFDDYFFF